MKALVTRGGGARLGPWICGAVLCGVTLTASVVSAQSAPEVPPPTEASVPEEEVAEGSPRAALSAYLELCREGRHDAAARYLELPDGQVHRGAELARRLKAVLDQHVWFDLTTVSAEPAGDTDDGLAARTEEIGQIPGPNGTTQPLRLVQRAEGWVFSRGTVNRIDGWYERLDRVWLLERLPPVLLRPGPRNLLYWQWIALPLLAALAAGLGSLLSLVTRRLLVRMASRTESRWDDELLSRIGRPLTFAWALAVTYLALPSRGLYRPAVEFLDHVVRFCFFLVFFWILAQSVDVARLIIAQSPTAKALPASRSLLPLGARVLKVVVLVVAIVALLSEAGYPVASLVAGLGIGGLAFALAAQKTVENLFGAFSIGADEPFREGDFVRIEDFVGTVEAIGLRSTRIRTLDRTVISIPNGKLADMRLESFTVRDRIRLACTVGLVYETTAAQMREVLAGLELVLRNHPKIWPDAVVVRFKELGASSLDIEVMAWFATPDWAEFQQIRQDVLLHFMEVVEEAGTSFAFPTQTVHLIDEGRGGDRNGSGLREARRDGRASPDRVRAEETSPTIG